MDGGAVLFDSAIATDKDAALFDFFQKATECKLLTNSSAYGTIFTITSTSNALVSISTTSNGVFACNKLIFKIGYIGEGSTTILGRPKRKISVADFNREVDITKEVYNNSLNVKFDPICPAILKTFFHNPAAQNEAVVRILRMLVTLLPSIEPVFSNYVGLIIMEQGNGVAVSDVFPDWGERNSYNDHDFRNTNDIKSIALINYAYSLYRLKTLGIQHGDAHLGNALLCKVDPDIGGYYGGYKVLLLDFGLSSKIPDGEIENINYKWYTERDYWSYAALQGVYRKLRAGRLEMINEAGAGIYADMNAFTTTLKQHIINHSIAWLIYITRNRTNLEILRRVVKSNIDEYPNLRTKSFLANYPTGKNEQESIEWLFTKGKVKQRINTFDIATAIVNVNASSNCCPNPQNNAFYNYLENGNQYNYAYSRLQRQLVRANRGKSLLIEADGFYLWIIGNGPDGKTDLYYIAVTNPGEIATKHAHLMKYANIQNYYLAGELVKADSIIKFNLSSGTYMFTPLKADFTNGVLNVAEMNKTLLKYSGIAQIFFALVLYDKDHPYRILSDGVTKLADGNRTLEPTFIVGSNKTMCGFVKHSRDTVGTPMSKYQTEATCKSARMPQRLLTGGSQIDDIKMAENSITFNCSTEYELFNGVPTKLIQYVIKNKDTLSEPMDILLQIIYIIKNDVNDINTGVNAIVSPVTVASELQEKQMIQEKYQLQKIEPMIAGNTRKNRRKNKSKRKVR